MTLALEQGFATRDLALECGVEFDAEEVHPLFLKLRTVLGWTKRSTLAPAFLCQKVFQ
jgi:hypothetical protein